MSLNDVCVNCGHTKAVHGELGCAICWQMDRPCYIFTLSFDDEMVESLKELESVVEELVELTAPSDKGVWDDSIRPDKATEYWLRNKQNASELADQYRLMKKYGNQNLIAVLRGLERVETQLEAERIRGERYWDALVHILHVDEWRHTDAEISLEEVADIANKALNPPQSEEKDVDEQKN
jgi:hypothetical protein